MASSLQALPPDLAELATVFEWDKKKFRILVQARNYLAEQAQLAWIISRDNGYDAPGANMGDAFRRGDWDEEVMRMLNWPGLTFVQVLHFDRKTAIIDVYLPDNVFTLQPLAVDQFGPAEFYKHFHYTPGMYSRPPTPHRRLLEYPRSPYGGGSQNGHSRNGSSQSEQSHTNGHASNGHSRNTSSQSGQSHMNGHSTNGQPQNSHPQDGVSENGISQNGISQNGISQNGISQNGISSNGHPQNGVSQSGSPYDDLPQNGDLKNGDLQNGSHSTNGTSQNGVTQNGVPDTNSGALQNGHSSDDVSLSALSLVPASRTRARRHDCYLREFMMTAKLPDRLLWEQVEQKMVKHNVIGGILNKMHMVVIECANCVLGTRDMLGWETDDGEIKQHPNDASFDRHAVEVAYIRLCYAAMDRAQIYERAYGTNLLIFPPHLVRSEAGAKWSSEDWQHAYRCAPRIIREVYQVEFERELSASVTRYRHTTPTRDIERMMLGHVFKESWLVYKKWASAGVIGVPKYKHED